MNSKDLFKNNDAVSISVGFILMFAVTVLIFSATILSFYTLSQQSEKAAMRESFRTMGSGLAVKITMVDTLASVINSYGGTVNTLEYEFSAPASVADKSYTVNITGPTQEIIMESDNGVRIVAPFNTSTSFTGIKIYSGAVDYVLKYDRSSNSLNIEEQ
ncbi:hypothetical protein ANME2D_01822 [Candidatus Methanoperedens nitroreducens]|uniref:Flagellin n=1 Tax=Candidatus Methanoperedens nitratireducens TaxID=1392998 RepID=A0A062V325_9EURY|nr:hypothetical protein [Candidatus Methanoperedens nitroreducens]KCZ71767.1 hypothetical protein ANME2D_01822 [Candidatus Methanoperedens nitroreducens]MDJ1422260.1 hypothetical protein [Candidatus Methanoperedens sp.]